MVTYLQWLYGVNSPLKVKAINPNAADANQSQTKELLYNHLRREKEGHEKNAGQESCEELRSWDQNL